MMLIILIICSFGILFLFTSNIKSMNLTSRLLAKGWEDVSKEESKFLRCSYCQTIITRGDTTPYCSKCRKFL
ncbi:hypothetical protein [Jeotgalibacillus proteolyticus]|uniref:Uncharacterized protein n=1 Tax=Jeotgalibacillus proteolyticus TaxID=2082395 RepID=A0A2S5GDI4_9BACL|nr:hypothetical protein [Jeotgalibacillus proteolyticus]PPA71102.1 hypothetical protein C4B60_10025 [Jeotgalibacillus proteolyticus]